MLNALAGAFIGWLAFGWIDRVLLALGWGVVACLYHALFSEDERRLFVEGQHRSGRRTGHALALFYLKKYRRAALIALVAAVASGIVAPARG